MRVTYSHHEASGEPGRLSAEAIWAVAIEARRQLCPNPMRLRVEVRATLNRLKRIEANGITLEVHIDLAEAVEDRHGTPVLGLTTHDRRWPGCVTVRLNAGLIGSEETLLRSTLFHEIGHVIFDGPRWTKSATCEKASFYCKPETGPFTSRMDWSEWRANEFMGGFLAPRSLLHRAMIKRAAADALPLRDFGALPVLDDGHVSEDRLSTLVFELAEVFGLSSAFIATRLQKYRLVTSALAKMRRRHHAASTPQLLSLG